MIRRDPERLPLAPHLHPPYLRLSEPYDLFMSAGCTLQLDRASMLENRGPKATHVEVLVNRVSDATYIILVPRNDPADPRVEMLNSKGNSRSAVIRTAEQTTAAIEAEVAAEVEAGAVDEAAAEAAAAAEPPER